MLDLLTVYKDRKPYPHKLSDAVDTYSITTANTHRAVDDVHCGECPDIPCQLLKDFSYDKEQGDNGARIEQCKKWKAEGAVYNAK